MSYTAEESTREQAKVLYLEGMSAQEIKDAMGLKLSVRAVQRWMVKFGVSRSIGDAFRNAVKRGRVHFHYKKGKVKRKSLSPMLRFKVLQRDNFKCVLCGGREQLEADHRDENKNNNTMDNLQTLCQWCNQGKSAAYNSKRS